MWKIIKIHDLESRIEGPQSRLWHFHKCGHYEFVSKSESRIEKIWNQLNTTYLVLAFVSFKRF